MSNKPPYTVEKLELQKGRDWWTIAGPCGSTYQAMDHATAMDLCDRLNGAYSEGLREGAQWIVKEGPSVEDIMRVVQEYLREDDTSSPAFDLRARLNEVVYGTPDFKNMPIEEVEAFLRSEGIDPEEERKYGRQVVARIREQMAAKAIAAAPRSDEGARSTAESAVPVSGAGGSETSPKQS